jgi:GrpB protein
MVGGERTLADRLAAAGVGDSAQPWAAWLQLRAAEGNRATVIDLYELVAAPRGLAAQELPPAERLSLARQAMSQTWPGFALTESSDRPTVPLVVTGYDPAWPQTYERWRQVVTAALGPAVPGIEHVGSTSVPGLAAKPIVDIQVSVADLSDEPRYVPQHVHVCAAGGHWERDHLLFRDYLTSPYQAFAPSDARRLRRVVALGPARPANGPTEP